MSKFNDWCNVQEAKLDRFINNLDRQAILDIMFPFLPLFRKKKKQPWQMHTLYETKTSQPIILRSAKVMSRYEQMYGKIKPGFGMDMVKEGIKREICEKIMQDDLFEWSIEEGPEGTRVEAKLMLHKF